MSVVNGNAPPVEEMQEHESAAAHISVPVINHSHSLPSRSRSPSPEPPLRKNKGHGALFKAYALALRSKAAGSGDLHAVDKAFFTNTSMRRGVPIGMHDAFTNGRVYSIADGIQDGRSPVASEGSDCPSFVKYLDNYIDHVEDTSQTDEARLRTAQEKYRAIKREASLQFELAEFKWKNALQRDPTMTLDDWIAKYGYDYTDACEERHLAKRNLRRAQKSGSNDVLRQKELMESALSSDHEVPGSNMPCTLYDVSRTATVAGGTEPKDVVYRPLHVLPGFRYSGDEWRDRGLKEQRDLSELRISLEDGFTGSWKDLGFADVRDREYSRDEMKRIKSVIGGWEMVLRYTDMQAFDISRGLWNVVSFRNILPPLARTAPRHLETPVFLTTRVLLAYNADLVLRLPEELFNKLFPPRTSSKTKTAGQERLAVGGEEWGVGVRPDTSTLKGPESQLLTELFQTFPFSKATVRENGDGENELHVRVGFNNLYPAVLGILAKKV